MRENIPGWKSVVDRLKVPRYLIGDDHDCNFRARKQRTDVGKYCFVNRRVTLGSQLTAQPVATLPYKSYIFVCEEK